MGKCECIPGLGVSVSVKLVEWKKDDQATSLGSVFDDLFYDGFVFLECP
jgi:hypothetical protein